jgi:predicted dehydrogenase
MATSNKIRVGIVGASPNRGFASIAHIPALQALPEFEISAVCTSRQDSADPAAKHYGVPLAFCDAEKLAQPFIATFLVRVTNNNHAPAVYVIIAAVITLVVLVRTRETAFAPLR